MNHHELSSLSPIQQEGVWSAWEINDKLTLRFIYLLLKVFKQIL